MRLQSNQTQDSGDQKKSVFDRLGRQLDTNRSFNRRSPARYGDHPMHQMMHEAEYGGRYARVDTNHSDMNWRHQLDRRHMPFGRDRHPPPIGPPPPHFDMDMAPGRQQPQYYPHPHPPQYQGNPNVPPGPPLMGPDAVVMGMQQQRRPSPKYDRHGNPIRGPIRMDHPPGMSPPRNFMGPPPPNPMMHPSAYDMMPIRPGMYPNNRWNENLDMGPPMHGQILQDERFIDPHRFRQQQQQPKGLMMINPGASGHQNKFEVPRYSKWRERRDVITNLDRQTAQSSSKTDSLKSSLQQPDNRGHVRKANPNKNTRQFANEPSSNKQSNAPVKKEPINSTENKGEPATNKSQNKQASAVKTEPTEISDGEIVDDEDSSDESDAPKTTTTKDITECISDNYAMNRLKIPYGRSAHDVKQYYDGKKRRRLHDREDYPMDYETISDEELDDFMSDKKLAENGKIDVHGGTDGKSSSEIELLNALGLDWANLIELSKQSRKEAPTTGSALRRFSMPNYLPTLGINRELAGSEIYDLMLRVCQ